MEGAAGDAGGGRRRAAAAEAHASGDAGTSARGSDESEGGEGQTLLPPTLRPAQLPRGPAWGMVLNMALYMATPMSMPATMKASYLERVRRRGCSHHRHTARPLTRRI